MSKKRHQVDVEISASLRITKAQRSDEANARVVADMKELKRCRTPNYINKLVQLVCACPSLLAQVVVVDEEGEEVGVLGEDTLNLFMKLVQRCEEGLPLPKEDVDFVYQEIYNPYWRCTGPFDHFEDFCMIVAVFDSKIKAALPDHEQFSKRGEDMQDLIFRLLDANIRYEDRVGMLCRLHPEVYGGEDCLLVNAMQSAFYADACVEVVARHMPRMEHFRCKTHSPRLECMAHILSRVDFVEFGVCRSSALMCDILALLFRPETTSKRVNIDSHKLREVDGRKIKEILLNLPPKQCHSIREFTFRVGDCSQLSEFGFLYPLVSKMCRLEGFTLWISSESMNEKSLCQALCRIMEDLKKGNGRMKILNLHITRNHNISPHSFTELVEKSSVVLDELKLYFEHTDVSCLLEHMAKCIECTTSLKVIEIAGRHRACLKEQINQKINYYLRMNCLGHKTLRDPSCSKNYLGGILLRCVEDGDELNIFYGLLREGPGSWSKV